jgi:hypothetical protein
MDIKQTRTTDDETVKILDIEFTRLRGEGCGVYITTDEGGWNRVHVGYIHLNELQISKPAYDTPEVRAAIDAARAKKDDRVPVATFRPAWHCGFCSRRNEGENRTCAGCGAPRVA